MQGKRGPHSLLGVGSARKEGHDKNHLVRTWLIQCTSGNGVQMLPSLDTMAEENNSDRQRSQTDKSDRQAVQAESPFTLCQSLQPLQILNLCPKHLMNPLCAQSFPKHILTAGEGTSDSTRAAKHSL